MIEPARLFLVGVLTASVAGAAAWTLVKPPPRLAARVRPYTPSARAALGLVSTPVGVRSDGIIRPITRSLAEGLSRLVDAASDEELADRLSAAGVFSDVPADQRVAVYRRRQLASFVIGVLLSVGAGWAMGVSAPGLVGLGVLGAVVGATRQRGRLEKTLQRRRERMRLEVYSVDQLLALRVRAGAGVLASVSDVVARGQGEVVGELRAVQASVRAGVRPADAFNRAASATPEPHCARTYAALATAEERGSDLALVLLALADDVRRSRRELLRRRAVRRRAAMLVPIIALMAPVMLLFIIAPLPRIVLGGL